MNRLIQVSISLRQLSLTQQIEKAKSNLKGKHRMSARGKYYEYASNKQGREKEKLMMRANHDMAKMIKKGKYDQIMVSNQGIQSKKGLKFIKRKSSLV